ncbi:NAD(P)-dependent oxidoreductase [soil metagenome]
MHSQAKPTVAITGASGFLGKILTEHFSGIGWDVIALVRESSRYVSSKNISYREYDLSKPPDSDILNGSTYLVHAAYIKKDAEHPKAATVNIKAAKELLRLSRQQNIIKNVFISSMSAHSDAMSSYGQQKVAIEKLFNSSRDISLRPGLIIGNGGIVKDMSSFMKTKHAVPLIGGGRQPVQIVSVHDMAVAVERALQSNLSGVLTIANQKVYSYKDFYTQLAEHLGVTVFFIPVPFFVMSLILNLADLLHIKTVVGSDNLLGLRKLRSTDTLGDLVKLSLNPSPLKQALSKERVR